MMVDSRVMVFQMKKKLIPVDRLCLSDDKGVGFENFAWIGKKRYLN